MHPWTVFVRLASILAIFGVTLAACGSKSLPLQTAAIASRCGKPPFRARPATISVSCSGKVVITHIKWGRTWGAPTTSATGTLTVKRGCTHDCGSARAYAYYAVRIVADRITMCPGRSRTYSVLTASVINGHGTFHSQTSNCGL